jgi:6-phosphogluconolactonase (cycloisomerase 2 family)
MQTRWSPAIALSLLAVFAAGCGGNKIAANPTPTPVPPCTAALPQEFAYQLDNGTVSMFAMDSCTGGFSATSPATVGTGIAPGEIPAEDLVVDPRGRFAYVANLVSNATDRATIAMYTIDKTKGVLTPTTPATIPTGFFPQNIAIDPSGKFIYTANSDDDTVSMFTVNQTTGLLTPTTPATVPTGGSPAFITVHPSGKFVYVTNQFDATVSMYSVDPVTGVLSPLTPATVRGGDFGITVDPSGRFAYAVGNIVGFIFQYTIDPNTGILQPGSTPVIRVGTGPTTIAVDPTSHFAYVVNRNDNTVGMFTINQTDGTLTPNATPTIHTGQLPFRILFDPAKRFLYVDNEESPASIYTVNPNGTLTLIGTTGGQAVSLAFAAP